MAQTPPTQTAPMAPMRARRNPRWIAAGVLAVCLGGLGSTLLYTQAGNATAVVRVNHAVARGDVIGPEDLGVITVGNVAGVSTVPADELGRLVGQTAISDLAEGSLLAPNTIGAPILAADQVRIGLRLTAGRLPASALPAGTRVWLVAVPAANSGGADKGEATVTGSVASSPTVAPDGASVLDVNVPTAQAERIARLAATDRLALVRLPER